MIYFPNSPWTGEQYSFQNVTYQWDGSRWISVTNPPFNEITYFYPTDNEPPAANFATFDTRNGHPVLDFDDTTAEYAIFSGVLPVTSGGNGYRVSLAYSMTSDIANTCGWTIEFERIGDQIQDIDSDSFGDVVTITAVTVPATSGLVDVVAVDCYWGSNIDYLNGGEQFRIRVKRDVTNDTAAGDAELHWVSIRAN